MNCGLLVGCHSEIDDSAWVDITSSARHGRPRRQGCTLRLAVSQQKSCSCSEVWEMTVSLQCPGCGTRHSASDSMAGKKAKCNCGTVLMVPPAPVSTSPESPITVQCSGCGTTHNVGASMAGKAARCKCGAVVQVPQLGPGPLGASTSGVSAPSVFRRNIRRGVRPCSACAKPFHRRKTPFGKRIAGPIRKQGQGQVEEL